MDMRPLFTDQDIQKRIQELGQRISEDYRHEPLLVIGVLKGSFIFLADLVRAIDGECEIDFIGVASYEGTESSGQVRLTHDLSSEVMGKHVLVVEDIVDTGRTIDFLLDSLSIRKPKSLKIAALLSKPEAHVMQHPLDYVGFEISREFVVGYGLDYNGRYRQLPHIMQMIT